MRPGHPARFALSLCAGLALVMLTRSTFAHAILLESTPSQKAIVAGPALTIKLRFNVRIDASRSRLTLVAPDASSRTLEITMGASPDVLTSHAAGLNPGEYRLRWQVLATDGHITRGEIPFQVAQR